MTKIITYARLTLLLALLSFTYLNSYARETQFEKNLSSEIKKFGDKHPTTSYLKLWINTMDGYTAWQNIKSAGDIYNVNWSRAQYYISIQEKYLKDGMIYTGGALIILFAYKTLCLYYIEYSGNLYLLRDNWSNRLDIDIDRLKSSIHQLLERELE